LPPTAPFTTPGTGSEPWAPPAPSANQPATRTY
jgi:hypothetical protein